MSAPNVRATFEAVSRRRSDGWTGTTAISFTYEGLGIPLVARATNEWTVQPHGERTLLISRAEVVLKGGLFGRLLEPMIARQLNRIGPRTLAAFKYLVEHGEPPPGRHSELPMSPIAC